MAANRLQSASTYPHEVNVLFPAPFVWHCFPACFPAQLAWPGACLPRSTLIKERRE